MSNFKSGSGNLDFGGGDEDDESEDTESEATQSPDKEHEDTESESSEQLDSSISDSVSSDAESTSGQPASDRRSVGESTVADSSSEEYPYFVRRNNVGDERDTRLEIHVRDKVAEQEAKFRNEVAEHLGASEISKTDAREFALLAAFHHPERVAELMEDEGFGTLS